MVYHFTQLPIEGSPTMSAVDAVKRLQGVSPDLGDVVDHLTLAHAEMLDRYGPLLGFSAPAPTEAVQFAAEQARKALVIDTTKEPAEKAAALMDKEAHRHDQIGRLAYWIAGYELAHGDASNAKPMQELGADHFELAAGLRGQMDGARLNASRPARTDPNLLQFPEQAERDIRLLPPEIQAEIAATSNQNEPGPGRSR